MALKTAMVEKEKIKVKPQARKDMNQEELLRLAASMEVKQLQPVGLLADLTMIWGHRRLAAAMLKKEITHLWAAIFEEEVSESAFLLMRATENFSRQDLTAWEKHLTCVELLEVNPHWQAKDLAEHIQLDPGMVTRLLSPGRCIQAVRDALAAGKIGISDTYAISRLPEADQAEALALKLGGASRDALASHARKQRNGDQPAVRLSKVKLPLPSGVALTASGQDIDLETLIDSLQELTKAAKKAAEEGIDIKTFARVCLDKSKA